jgi:hypothetical protein
MDASTRHRSFLAHAICILPISTVNPIPLAKPSPWLRSPNHILPYTLSLSYDFENTASSVTSGPSWLNVDGGVRDWLVMCWKKTRWHGLLMTSVCYSGRNKWMWMWMIECGVGLRLAGTTIWWYRIGAMFYPLLSLELGSCFLVRETFGIQELGHDLKIDSNMFFAFKRRGRKSEHQIELHVYISISNLLVTEYEDRVNRSVESFS